MWLQHLGKASRREFIINLNVRALKDSCRTEWAAGVVKVLACVKLGVLLAHDEEEEDPIGG